MRRLGWALALAAIAAALPRVATATTGTCTITQMFQTNPYPLGFDFAVPAGIGVAMPVEFDEAAGTFSMSRDTWFATFGAEGAAFVTIGGVHGFMRMMPGTSSGTIDASGEITLPDFPIENSTDFVSPEPHLPVEGIGISTGAVVRSISVVSRASVGVPLDFDTGEVVLSGLGFIMDAPGTSGTNIAGVRFACTMSPIPNKTALRAGASLEKVRGKAKVSKKTLEDGGKADLLSLRGTLVPGPQPITLDGSQDLVLGVSVAGVDVTTVYVRGGRFTKKGKKLVVTRDDTCKIKKGAMQGVCKDDGTTTCESFRDCSDDPSLQILSGQKRVLDLNNTLVAAQLGGTLTVVPAKGGAATLTVKLQGLDLSTLTGKTDVSVAVGAASAGARVTTSGSKIK
jgi:hypothetical protein